MKLVILDRDGVINHDSDNYIKSVEEFQFIPGSLEAMARLSRVGTTVAIATNQSGIARGYYGVDTLEAIHEKLRLALAQLGGEVATIAYCPHGPSDGCSCRKPDIGLYLQISKTLSQPLSGVPVIGDSLRDLESANAVGAQPILVMTGKGERTLATNSPLLSSTPIYPDLAAAVDGLLQEEPA